MTCQHISTTLIWKVSLGPSNDAPVEVQMEIRAAEIAYVGMRRGLRGEHEKDGWMAHVYGYNVDGDGEHTGFLAREIHTHAERCDADAWSWDIARPLAAQSIEIKAQYNAIGALCDAVRDSGATMTLHGVPVTEGELRAHVEQSVDAKLKRVPYAEDQLPLPVVNAPVLPPLTAAEEVLEAIYSSLENVDDETKDRELARAGIRWFEVEPLAEVATDTRLKALEAGQVELFLAAPDALQSRLRQARGIADLGIGRAAKLLEIPSAELEDIEAGKQSISEFDLLAFADAYNVSLAWLTSGDGQPRSGA